MHVLVRLVVLEGPPVELRIDLLDVYLRRLVPEGAQSGDVSVDHVAVVHRFEEQAVCPAGSRSSGRLVSRMSTTPMD